MLKSNGFVVNKVFRSGCLLILLMMCSLRIHAIGEVPDNGSHWVDSVYNVLSMEQRVRQLLFPILENYEESNQGWGGVILADNRTDFEQDRGLSMLKGFLSNEYLFESQLGIDPNIMAATGDEMTFKTGAFLSGLRLKNKGFDFIFSEDSAYPITTSDTSKQTRYIEEYQKGLKEAGVRIWRSKDANNYDYGDGILLNSYLERNNLEIGSLGKKDLKKIWKSKKSKPLIFYHTNFMDINLSKGLLAADMLIFSDDPQFYLDHIASMISRNKLKKKLLEQKVKRILATKYLLRTEVHEKPDLMKEAAFEHDIRKRSPVIVKNQDDILPIVRLDDRHFASLSLGVFDSDTFQESLENYTYFSHFGEADFLHNEQKLRGVLGHYDYVIAGFSFPDQADPNNPDIQRRINFLEALAANTKVIVVVFGSSKWLSKFSSPKSVLLAHLSDSGYESVAPQIIFGALEGSGIMPIPASDQIVAGIGITTNSLSRLAYSLPEDLRFDSMMEQKIDFIVSKAIENFATPGCQVLVARNGDVVLNKGYGFYTYDSLQQVTNETMYDLASVTKVTGTLQATMFLEGEGAFNLDDKASSHLHDLKNSNKEEITIRKILVHQAGLQSYYPFYKKTLRGDKLNPQYLQLSKETDYNQTISPGIFGHQSLEDSVWSWTVNSRLRTMPEGYNEYDYTYSDLGFLMMFKLNEQLMNQPMEDFLSQNFYDPLGMSSTCYQPLCRFPLADIAPTERDYDFRNSLVWGLVHDENAALTGGVGGHAGLFSNANDLAKLLQMNLQDGYYGGIQYMKKGTISKFSKKQYDGNRRGLGWDKPSFGDYKNTAKYSSGDTFGHLGFTGTALWVDPKYELIYIFLSNRIHPNRENDKLMVDNIRSRIHDVIYESMPEFRQGSPE